MSDDFYVHSDIIHVCNIYNLDPINVSIKQNVEKYEMINYALNIKTMINKRFDNYNKLLRQRYINYMMKLGKMMHVHWRNYTRILCETEDIRYNRSKLDISLMKEIALLFYKIYRLAIIRRVDSLYSLCQSFIIGHVIDDINRFPIYMKSIPSLVACDLTHQYVSNMYYLRLSSLNRALAILIELETDKATHICTKLAPIITNLWDKSHLYN